LTTIVLAVVGTVFVGALRTLGVSNAKGDLTGLSEIAMETITGPLRAADYAPPGQSEYSSAVLEASYNAVTVRSERYDQPLADSLATSILAANATSKVGLYLQSTKMVSKQIRGALW
jgi:hypothetical protein